MDKMYDVIIIGAGVTGCSVARALAKYRLRVAVLEKEFKAPDLSYTESDITIENFKVTVDCPELCPRYSAHYVTDVKI